MVHCKSLSAPKERGAGIIYGRGGGGGFSADAAAPPARAVLPRTLVTDVAFVLRRPLSPAGESGLNTTLKVKGPENFTYGLRQERLRG